MTLDGARSSLQMAKDLNLAIHPYTFRQEAVYVSPKFDGDAQKEAAYFYCCLEVDATFSEFPDQMREVSLHLSHLIF